MCVNCRESLQQSLKLVMFIILGAAYYLPMWTGEQVEGW